jgi:hypothetical protein
MPKTERSGRRKGEQARALLRTTSDHHSGSRGLGSKLRLPGRKVVAGVWPASRMFGNRVISGRSFLRPTGAPRIHGELLKLGFEVAQSSVAKT